MSGAPSPWALDVAEADFEHIVLEGSKVRPVVVDFWAPWCGPCRMLGPVLEKLVTARNGDLLLAKVNIDEAQRLAAAFGIDSIPAVKAFRDGRVVAEFVGVYPEPQLQAFLDQLQPTEAQQLAGQAERAADPVQAEALFRRALAQDPKLEAARLGLARQLVRLGRLDEIDELLEPFSSEGEAGEEAQRIKAEAWLRRKAQALGDLEEVRRRHAAAPDQAQQRLELGIALAAAGQYPEALAMLLSAAERDPGLGASAVRETMVNVFFLLGVRHSLADEYRRKLSELLY
jgi:putative thioredoxin